MAREVKASECLKCGRERLEKCEECYRLEKCYRCGYCNDCGEYTN